MPGNISSQAPVVIFVVQIQQAIIIIIMATPSIAIIVKWAEH